MGINPRSGLRTIGGFDEFRGFLSGTHAFLGDHSKGIGFCITENPMIPEGHTTEVVHSMVGNLFFGKA